MISKGLFGKNGRSGGAPEREPVVDDEHYVLKVINQPLLEQTRLTRISKRLEDSRDRTEFWMPAFPWRAIDYLNYKGTDVEGLYRVPGSGPQIKKWQRKFDEGMFFHAPHFVWLCIVLCFAMDTNSQQNTTSTSLHKTTCTISTLLVLC